MKKVLGILLLTFLLSCGKNEYEGKWISKDYKRNPEIIEIVKEKGSYFIKRKALEINTKGKFIERINSFKGSLEENQLFMDFSNIYKLPITMENKGENLVLDEKTFVRLTPELNRELEEKTKELKNELIGKWIMDFSEELIADTVGLTKYDELDIGSSEKLDELVVVLKSAEKEKRELLELKNGEAFMFGTPLLKDGVLELFGQKYLKVDDELKSKISSREKELNKRLEGMWYGTVKGLENQKIEIKKEAHNEFYIEFEEKTYTEEKIVRKFPIKISLGRISTEIGEYQFKEERDGTLVLENNYKGLTYKKIEDREVIAERKKEVIGRWKPLSGENTLLISIEKDGKVDVKLLYKDGSILKNKTVDIFDNVALKYNENSKELYFDGYKYERID